jgi:hypothetical protein
LREDPINAAGLSCRCQRYGDIRYGGRTSARPAC